MNRSGAAAWRQSIRPLAQANIGPYLIYGLCLGLAQGAQFSGLALTLLFGWGCLAHCVIIWTNDLADADIDPENRQPTLFSGGSRVLPEGQLQPAAIARAARWAGVLLLGYSALLSVRVEHAVPFGSGLATLALSHAYSCLPLQLSRRGHGEWLQATGIGVVLPLVGYAIAGADLGIFPKLALLPSFGLGLAGNILTALPDYAADLRCQKRSPAVRLGQQRAKVWLTATLAAAGLAAAVTLPGLDDRQRFTIGGLALASSGLLCIYAQIRRLWSDRSRAAVEFCFAASVAAQVQLLAWLYLLLRD